MDLRYLDIDEKRSKDDNLKVPAYWQGPDDELLCVRAWGTAPEIKNTFFTRLGFSLDHEAGLYRLFEKAGVARPT